LASAAAGLSVLLLTGCAGAGVAPLPDEHPANAGARPAPPITASRVLTLPDDLPDPLPPEMKTGNGTDEMRPGGEGRTR
jgi:hypothetical protein